MLLDKENDPVFVEYYMDNISHRLIQSSMEVESEVTDYSHAMQILKVSGHQLALNNVLFNYGEGFIEPMHFITLLQETAEFVTTGEVDKLRNTYAEVYGSNVPRTDAKYIRMRLYQIIDDYNYFISNAKTDDDKYQAIATFHINFMHIHPFEDGNGRVGRIILTKHLLSNNLAPALITPLLKAKYCDFIENTDYNGMAEFFKELSKNEFDEMKRLYTYLESLGYFEKQLKK